MIKILEGKVLIQNWPNIRWEKKYFLGDKNNHWQLMSQQDIASQKYSIGQIIGHIFHGRDELLLGNKFWDRQLQICRALYPYVSISAL